MAKTKYPISKEFFPINKFAPPMSRSFVKLAQMGMKTPGVLWKDPQLDVQSRKIPGYQNEEMEVFILTPKGLMELPPAFFIFMAADLYLKVPTATSNWP